MKTSTVTIQIGNSDDKLTQTQWSAFVREVQHHVKDIAHAVHFHGHSPGDASWQNACWVVEAHQAEITLLRTRLVAARREFLQTFLAWTEGETKFI